MNILVTGGAGYIGSHTCVELLNSGYKVVVVDNLTNSSKVSIERVTEICNKPIRFYQCDLCDETALDLVFRENNIDAVIHFAGHKAVGESVEIPLEYYANNLNSTLVLCNVMKKHGVKTLVFSSSATVYGVPRAVPIDENFPLSATNPYGRTKLFIEQMLQDLCVSDSEWNIVLLRYFNPVGAHESGLIGEDPNGLPNNLVPFISQVAIGKLPKLLIFGDDYDTKDGTGVRDYIHVVDLAYGHVKAIEYQFSQSASSGCRAVNLGTGVGYSVLEMIKAFQDACGREVPYAIAPRRSGDVAECYANAAYAEMLLGFKSQLGLQQMCEDVWRWQSKNPRGYTQ